jgi:hypothetical protein
MGVRHGGGWRFIGDKTGRICKTRNKCDMEHKEISGECLVTSSWTLASAGYG